MINVFIINRSSRKREIKQDVRISGKKVAMSYQQTLDGADFDRYNTDHRVKQSNKTKPIPEYQLYPFYQFKTIPNQNLPPKPNK